MAWPRDGPVFLTIKESFVCEINCFCLVCELVEAETRGVIRLSDIDSDSLTRDQLKALDLFDEFVKSGLGS